MMRKGIFADKYGHRLQKRSPNFRLPLRAMGNGYKNRKGGEMRFRVNARKRETPCYEHFSSSFLLLTRIY